MVSIFNKYLPLYYNEAIRKNLTARRMIKKTGRYSPTSMGSGQRKHEGGTDMNGIGIGIISLLVYIAAILVINMVLKRKMAEAMMWSFLIHRHLRNPAVLSRMQSKVTVRSTFVE